MVDIKGFASEERELSELEKKLKTIFVEKEKDAFSVYVDRHIKISMSSQQGICGCYKGLTINGFLVLTPWLQRVFYPDSPEKDNEGKVIYSLENEPCFVRAESVICVAKFDKEFLDRIVEQNESFFDKRKQDYSI